MDEFFLKAKFKLIHITSEDAWGKCLKCGDTSEQWVRGRLHNKKTKGYYTYPDLKLRKAKECSSCVDKAKIDFLSRRIRSSKIYPRNCQMCDSVFIAKNKKGRFCNIECSQKHFNSLKIKTYNLECEYCEKKFINNKFKKHCSISCRKKARYPKLLKSCKTCSEDFIGSKGNVYCSDKCNPGKSAYIRPKKTDIYRKCLKCDSQVVHPTKLCVPCKSIKKPNRVSKKYNKECPTCDKKFVTIYNYKIYCKPAHIPSSIEAKKLRKQTVRKSKLDIESWKDINDFKKGRPEGMHLDHIIPLNHPDVCGLHNTWNFQWLSPTDNSKKSNKFDGTMENIQIKK